MVETPQGRSVSQAIELKLEVERVALLYRQNVPGVCGLLLYAFSYAYVCGDVMGTSLIQVWLGVVATSAVLRLAASWLWLRRRQQITSLSQVRVWLRFIQSQLFVSGAAWGVAGWMMRYSHTPEQQIFVSMTVVFMVAGGIVCWSISPRAMLLVVVPAFVPWSLGQALSDNPISVLMGVLSFLYLVLGSRVGMALHRYVEDSLKLNIENAQLNEVLKTELAVKARNEESLRLALASLKIQGKIQHERDVHEAANKAKSMFLANASHEIRTPLAAISGYVEALLQSVEGGALDLKQTKADLKTIDRNSRHLISLVNDFLDLSKLETGRLEVLKRPMDLRAEIQQSIQMVQSVAAAKGLQLEVEIDPAVPLAIESDALRFRQILVNVLSNACKFSSAGRIHLRASLNGSAKSADSLLLRISDSGPGMDETTQRHLFEPFMRGTSAQVQRVSGSGLGLTLSRNLARLLGGDLKLIRSRLDEGSEFEFSISIGEAVGFVGPEATEQNSKVNQLVALSILVVDDDADLRDLTKRFLERQGANVEVAPHGKHAVELATKRVYDAILMDMKMPILDGYQATMELRARGYKAPIIALTAYANSEDKKRSLEAGCDDYLTKPVDFSRMLKLVRNHVPHREAPLRSLDS